MTSSKLLRLFTEDEVTQYEDANRLDFQKSTTQNLEVYLQLNYKLRQQVGIKISLLEDILGKRKPDNKSKQFKDAE